MSSCRIYRSKHGRLNSHCIFSRCYCQNARIYCAQASNQAIHGCISQSVKHFVLLICDWLVTSRETGVPCIQDSGMDFASVVLCRISQLMSSIL